MLFWAKALASILTGMAFTVLCPNLCGQADSLRPLHLQVENRLEHCFETGSPQPLLNWCEELNFQQDKERDFWEAFAYFHVAVFWHYRDEADLSTASIYCDSAQRLLERYEDSPDHMSLLAYIECFALQYHRGVSQWQRALKSRARVRRAYAAAPRHAQVLFVYGNMLIRAPGMWQDLDRGIALLDESMVSYKEGAFAQKPYSWGLEECYEALVMAYAMKGDTQSVQRIYDLSLHDYPASRTIQQAYDEATSR